MFYTKFEIHMQSRSTMVCYQGRYCYWRRYKQHTEETNNCTRWPARACITCKRGRLNNGKNWPTMKTLVALLAIKSSKLVPSCNKIFRTTPKTLIKLTRPDATTAITSEEKAQVLATHVASKMSAPWLRRNSPIRPSLQQRERILYHLDKNRAMGEDQD